MKLNLKFNIHHYQILRRDEFEIADLSGHFELERPAYLYCILSKNRISINHKYTKFTDSYIKTEFIIQNKNQFLKEKINFKHKYVGLQEVKVISNFPYSQFKIIDENGSSLIFGKATYFPEHEEAYEQVKNKELLDYEILYIGQSVLSKNKIPVLGRITKHSTFQKILEDYNQFHPDKELFCFFFSFKQDALLDINEEVTKEDKENFIKGFQKNYSNPTSKEVKQNVTLLEATLINYFKPTYNDKFFQHLPSKKHVSYRGVSNLNLDKVNVLFGMESLLPRLYTNEVGRKNEHRIEYKIK